MICKSSKTRTGQMTGTGLSAFYLKNTAYLTKLLYDGTITL